ncbi:N-acetylmuramoyl-L-alanine amidase [Sporanaerobium hydrogeniformans]|uniref:N-acetylmuramoyl-L-alanine amidase n=1 Tax=Sporanaerobium hydrogeniformans TaxID=3072179 RepID=A0AC61DAT9_9FIRM|nr:N-acetylmuramoyl-L-alanine amidase [Sporanaerobium hydrogeniformans]PHV70384.1 N-acetylmuramoyl-L-alanine amidase [Sporanaerobium hydrogeniformans]
MKRSKMTILMFTLVGMIFMASYFKYATQAVETIGLATASKIIIIDPGHGGFDPGKQGIQGENEKDLNLKIALKLRDYLEQSGAVVVMTRTTDDDTDGMDGVKYKSKDMKERKKIAEGGDILISIHQNSFTQPSVKGAQTFYNKKSDKAKLLAELIQSSIKEYVDTSNRREPKGNTDYYVLKATSIPSVIVECGFLTNPEEEKKLNTEAYQEEMAWGIYHGIVKYFEKQEIN